MTDKKIPFDNKAHCVRCQQPINLIFKPFCSKRCQQLDLGQWLKGGYTIPGEAMDGDNTVLNSLDNLMKED